MISDVRHAHELTDEEGRGSSYFKTLALMTELERGLGRGAGSEAAAAVVEAAGQCQKILNNFKFNKLTSTIQEKHRYESTKFEIFLSILLFYLFFIF